MKTTETVTLPLFFVPLFIWCGGAFFNNVLCRNAMSVFLCSFHQLSMFCLCSNLSPCNFCLFVVPLHLRFCFFRKSFQYAVARCVGYFSTTFLCRNAMSVFMQFSSVFNVFCAVIFRRVIFVCSLCRYICDFVSFVKVFNMQLQCVLVFFNNVLCRNARSVFLCSFHQFSVFCLCSNLSPCILSVGCAVVHAILFFTEVLCFCM